MYKVGLKMNLQKTEYLCVEEKVNDIVLDDGIIRYCLEYKYLRSITVSYTHLDVYKRQLVVSTHSWRLRFLSFSFLFCSLSLHLSLIHI